MTNWCRIGRRSDSLLYHRVCPIYGGLSKLDQFKELRIGCEVIVCTPSRLIDMIKKKATNMQRATFVVLDEADKMFDMGFGTWCAHRLERILARAVVANASLYTTPS